MGFYNANIAVWDMVGSRSGIGVKVDGDYCLHMKKTPGAGRFGLAPGISDRFR